MRKNVLTFHSTGWTVYPYACSYCIRKFIPTKWTPARYALSVWHHVPDVFRHKWIGRGSVTSPGRMKYPGDKNISEHKVPHIIMQQLRGAVHKCTGYMDG